jgi:hypothetical protein
MSPNSDLESIHFLSEEISPPRRKSFFPHQSLAPDPALWQHFHLLFSSSLNSHSLLFFVTSFIWGCFLLIYVSSIPPCHLPQLTTMDSNSGRSKRYLKCGNSTEAAKRLGCKYDILSNNWMPGICIDQEAVEEYQLDGTWFGFADEART